MALVVLALGMALAAAPAGTTVTPFRTEVAPRVDPVFGDAAKLRETITRYLALHSEMEQVRSEFSSAVHATLSQLAHQPTRGAAARGCPAPAGAEYARALAAGGRYLALGRRLEGRYREIRRAQELGEAAGLTPDYRTKMKQASDLYRELLRDYREMRVAFYEQLGAEMRHARCVLPAATAARPVTAAGTAARDTRPALTAAPSDPADPAAWQLEDPAPGLSRQAQPLAGGAPLARGSSAVTPPPAAAPAIWITIDNARCPQPSQLSIDGASLGMIAGHKKVTVRTRAGPHEVCVLPSSDTRTCDDAGTLRRAYLHDGWTLVVRCEK